MGRRRDRKHGTLGGGSSRRVKLDLSLEDEPTSSETAADTSAKVEAGKDDEGLSAGCPSPPSQSGLQGNPLSLLGQYSDEEEEEKEARTLRESSEVTYNDQSDQLDDQVADFLADLETSGLLREGSVDDPSSEDQPAKTKEDEHVTPALVPILPDDEPIDTAHVPIVGSETVEGPDSLTSLEEASCKEVKTNGEWQAVLHEESGDYYYWNTVTGETTWEDPTLKTYKIEGEVTFLDDVNDASKYGAEEFESTLYNQDNDSLNQTAAVTQSTALGKAVDPSLYTGRFYTALTEGGHGAQTLDTVTAHQNGPSQILKWAESLVVRLREITRTTLDDMPMHLRLAVEADIRLSDCRSLQGACGEAFWGHMQVQLQKIESFLALEDSKVEKLKQNSLSLSHINQTLNHDGGFEDRNVIEPVTLDDPQSVLQDNRVDGDNDVDMDVDMDVDEETSPSGYTHEVNGDHAGHQSPFTYNVYQLDPSTVGMASAPLITYVPQTWQPPPPPPPDDEWAPPPPPECDAENVPLPPTEEPPPLPSSSPGKLQTEVPQFTFSHAVSTPHIPEEGIPTVSYCYPPQFPSYEAVSANGIMETYGQSEHYEQALSDKYPTSTLASLVPASVAIAPAFQVSVPAPLFPVLAPIPKPPSSATVAPLVEASKPKVKEDGDTITSGGSTVEEKKAANKVSKSKKRAQPGAGPLRSKKKVAVLVDKWMAAKEELHGSEEDEDKVLYDPAALEKKREKEIEEWRRKQIASGEALENANFQPLGTLDWRERVKRAKKGLSQNASMVDAVTSSEDKGKQKLNVEELSKNLPSGWRAYFDDSSGDVYYANLETKETTWDRPVAHAI